MVREFSLSIEKLLREIKSPIYKGSDEILRNPYREIISVLENRVPQEKIDKFKIYYQAIEGYSLQELAAENYNIALLIEDLKKIIRED